MSDQMTYEEFSEDIEGIDDHSNMILRWYFLFNDEITKLDSVDLRDENAAFFKNFLYHVLRKNRNVKVSYFMESETIGDFQKEIRNMGFVFTVNPNKLKEFPGKYTIEGYICGIQDKNDSGIFRTRLRYIEDLFLYSTLNVLIIDTALYDGFIETLKESPSLKSKNVIIWRYAAK